jgi:hypothetical protein
VVPKNDSDSKHFIFFLCFFFFGAVFYGPAIALSGSLEAWWRGSFSITNAEARLAGLDGFFGHV